MLIINNTDRSIHNTIVYSMRQIKLAEARERIEALESKILLATKPAPLTSPTAPQARQVDDATFSFLPEPLSTDPQVQQVDATFSLQNDPSVANQV